jgi:hypothetical protein
VDSKNTRAAFSQRRANGDVLLIGSSSVHRIVPTQSSTAPLALERLHEIPGLPEDLRDVHPMADGALLVQTNGLGLGLWDGGQLTILRPPDVNRAYGHTVGPEGGSEAVAFMSGNRDLVWVESGTPREDQLPGDRFPTTLLYDRDLGYFAGSNLGEIWMLVEDTWELYAQSPQQTRVQALLPFRGGLLFSGETGFIGWAGDGVACSLTDSLQVGISARYFSRLGERILVAGPTVGSIQATAVAALRFAD